jgi:hypothetical protein
MPRYLDPASRLGEVLFGLIMVLSVTLTARLTVAEGPEGMHQLVLAAIGCNVAWGLIDGVMYVMGAVTERTAKARILKDVQQAADDDAGRAVIRDRVLPAFETVAAPAVVQRLEEALRDYIRAARPVSPGISADDLKGAAACFALVFLSTLPVVLLYLVMADPAAAVRASNILLLSMLFVTGVAWGRFAGTNIWWSGASMVGIGLVLVGVAVLFGG